MMRDFSDEFLETYLHRVGEAALSSVGAYQLEGLGAQLFERIDGLLYNLGCRFCRYLGICATKELFRYDADWQGESSWCYGVADFAFPPPCHGYWLREYAIDGAYLPFSVDPEL